MQATQFKYPVFEANQVLTNAHLNQIYNYLDEQERLTRTNLIGIGIVCGLEINLKTTATTTTIQLSKGCGITSDGYLILEPQDVALTRYRKYTLPPKISYPAFIRDNEDTQYDLWELFPNEEPGATPLASPETANFLDNKAVVIFLELKKESLRNCSPNNCNDKGAEVMATVRRLLIDVGDLAKIIAQANKIPGNVTGADLETVLSARLKLPDLRLPRYDVPNTGPATSQQVLAAFLGVFNQANNKVKLVTDTQAALTAAYKAFEPLLKDRYPTDPFITNFPAKFGFLENVPQNPAQVRFLPYYYAFFDDLLQAYHEFCSKGQELLCTGCPPANLFPRHLMLGVLKADLVPAAALYRHPFLPSPAIGGCEDQTRELGVLFQRLVEMIAQFTITPPLPGPVASSPTDVQIRITPSRLANEPISDQAIPYYYQPTGAPPLYQLWNPAKTRRGRAHLNLGYQSDKYVPTPPPFVLRPLQYDLAPYNFLRIEGHLGKNYQSVMNTLLSFKSTYRLPIEIIALRTGAFDENMAVDLRKENCRFQDLETLYRTLKAELICFLCKEVQYFYHLQQEVDSQITTPIKPKLPLLVECAPDFLVQPQTVGRFFEDWFSKQPGGVIPDIPPSIILNILSQQNIGNLNIVIFYVLIYISKLYDQLTGELAQLDFVKLETRFRDLVQVTEAVEQEREQAIGQIEGNTNLLNWEELDDRLEAIIFNCHPGALRALQEEYERRIRAVKQKQFLSFFLRQHPGIQHKAGVPLGGTFLIVYHEDPAPVKGTGQPSGTKAAEAITGRRQASTGKSKIVSDGLRRLFVSSVLSEQEKILLATDLETIISDLDPLEFKAPTGSGPLDRILTETVSELTDGTVIADFFLPYLCCSDCAPVQYVLPKTPLTFTVKIGCTKEPEEGEELDRAQVDITPHGGVGPYRIKVDEQDYQPLEEKLELVAGSHQLTLKDGEETESKSQTILIPERLVFGEPGFECLDDSTEYTAFIQFRGGTPPFTVNRGTVTPRPEAGDNIFTSDNLPSDTDIAIIVTDSRGCTATVTVNHTCLPPVTFRIQLACTNEQGLAQATVTPQGGREPYAYQVDGSAFADLPASIALTTGVHTLVLRDSAGTVTEPLTLTVPTALQISPERYIDQVDGNTYQVTFAVSGGTNPIQVNGTTLTSNSFTSPPVKSGESFDVAIRDSAGCQLSRSFTHTVAPPCTLPCEGASIRCGHLFWLPEPTPERQLEFYQAQIEAFRFVDQNGATIDLAQTGELDINAPVAELNARFEETVKRWLERINKVVTEKVANPDWFVLHYSKDPESSFNTLLIERFTCHEFTIVFRLDFSYRDAPDSRTVIYTPAGTQVRLNNHNDQFQHIPAFSFEETNKCLPDPKWTPRCAGTDLQLKIEAIVGQNNIVRLRAVTNDAEEPEHYLWEVEDAVPSLLTQKQGSTELIRTFVPQKKVRLSAFTQKGCRVTVEDTLTAAGTDG